MCVKNLGYKFDNKKKFNKKCLLCCMKIPGEEVKKALDKTLLKIYFWLFKK